MRSGCRRLSTRRSGQGPDDYLRLQTLRAGDLSPMPAHEYDETVEALIKMEVACRLALESLAKLPAETEQALRRHIEKLCEVTERELNRLQRTPFEPSR